ncbi:MAG: tRNA pseudouridine(38-40) synthase TruA [Chloroflexi bacterium]|nr:tRNA pseudouridine(38-40) synthase TruA [Chloroflexota bacterium]
MVPRRIKMTVAYDGTTFHGFQRQKDLPTIQGELERALSRVLNQDITVICAGRTDTGVHALGQVVSFRTTNLMPCEVLFRALNAVLDPAVAVRAVENAHPKFHARFWAASRIYRYHLVTSPSKLVLGRNVVTHINRPLAIEPMQKAARDFLGEHDFSSFRNSKSADRNPVRNILGLEISKGGFSLPDEMDGMEKFTFEIEGKSFLSGMVRLMVGTLIRIGSGKFPQDIIPELLEKRDPSCGAPPAPPEGLYLYKVIYPDEPPVNDSQDHICGNLPHDAEEDFIEF